MCTIHIVLFLCTHTHTLLLLLCAGFCSYSRCRFFSFRSLWVVPLHSIVSHLFAYKCTQHSLLHVWLLTWWSAFFLSLYFFSFLYRVYLFCSIWSKCSCMCVVCTLYTHHVVCVRGRVCVCVINIITKLFYAYISMRQGVQVFARILAISFSSFPLRSSWTPFLFRTFSPVQTQFLEIRLAQPVQVRNELNYNT